MLILFIFHRWLARIALITRMFNFWNQDQIILKQALLTRTKLMYICFLVLRIGPLEKLKASLQKPESVRI